MKVTLTAEGTYPHQYGGVSVWCDQLVRALPGHEFAVVALVASGAEPVSWELPANVTELVTVPLWGPPPRPARRRPAGWRAAPRRAVPAPVRDLIAALVGGEPGGEGIGPVLRGLSEFARHSSLTAALSSEAAVRLLCASWRERWPALPAVTGGPASPPGQGAEPPTLHDAVTALQLTEHALRPLSGEPVRADLTHVVTNGLGTLPALTAKWRHGVPLIVSEHGVYLREQYLHLRRPPFGWPVKELYLRFLAQVCALGYREADVIIPGNVYNRRWEAQLGADPGRVRTVYNGVNPDDFPLVTTEPDGPVISWAGRIDPVKDLATLLRAHALIVRQLPGARLRIFGAPGRGREAYLRQCTELARELGIAHAVTFEGRVPEVRDAYAAGTIVVLCSVSEGFPYSLIEAMTCGRACVATDVGGVSEALADGAGLVVPPRDPAALARACLRLLRDPAARAALGAAARRRALEHFTAEASMTAFSEIYAQVGTGCRLIPAAERADTATAAVIRSDDAELSPVGEVT